MDAGRSTRQDQSETGPFVSGHVPPTPLMTADVQQAIRSALEHPFSLIMEAVSFRLDRIQEHEVRLYELIPKAEYSCIRIYVSDVTKIRTFLSSADMELSYVSFVGKQRQGMDALIEATDRTLIATSPADSPIIGYFSLQDPQLAWVNLVLFDDAETLGSWVRATAHADDWAKAAALFTGVEKSIGNARFTHGKVTLDPQRLVSRNYEVA